MFLRECYVGETTGDTKGKKQLALKLYQCCSREICRVDLSYYVDAKVLGSCVCGDGSRSTLGAALQNIASYLLIKGLR